MLVSELPFEEEQLFTAREIMSAKARAGGIGEVRCRPRYFAPVPFEMHATDPGLGRRDRAGRAGRDNDTLRAIGVEKQGQLHCASKGRRSMSKVHVDRGCSTRYAMVGATDPGSKQRAASGV